jgi:hypothetical protein
MRAFLLALILAIMSLAGLVLTPSTLAGHESKSGGIYAIHSHGGVHFYEGGIAAATIARS